MRVIETAREMRDARASAEGPVGFVPTMGALHQGHLSLVQRARAECRTVVPSIYVNPTQFGPSEDFERYPRDLERDLQLCEEAGVDLVFAPPSAEVYPAGYRTYVEVVGLQDRWEGATRPGHFRGVATVVTVLLGTVQPDRAYFGEKDFQQLQVIRRLVQDLRLDVEIVGCPTMREADGLARSSRNAYLQDDERRQAAAVYAALRAAQERLTQGERDGQALCAVMGDLINQTPGARLDYAAVVDPASLEPLARVEGPARALIAVHLGAVHLIDNIALEP